MNKIKKLQKYVLSQASLRRVITAIVLSVAATLPAVPASAATLTSASTSLSDPRPSQTSNYTLQVSSVSLSATGCLKAVFATTSTGTTVPTGFSSTGAGVAVNTTSTNYTPTPATYTLDKSVNGTIKFTKASGETPANASNRVFQIDGITNGSTQNTTYYVQFTTYTNSDCATGPLDSVTMAFIYTDGQAVTITVDPSLSFSVTGLASGQVVNGATANVTTTSTTVPLGTPTIVLNRVAAQDITVGTNAANGYTVYIRYTQKPTFGSSIIADSSGSNTTPAAFSAAGTEAFGYTTNDTVLGTGTPGRFGGGNWAAFTTSNAEVAFNAGSVNADVTRVGFQVGIDNLTKAGNYTSTVIYTATPVF